MPVVAAGLVGDEATFAAVAAIEHEIKVGAVQPDVISQARRIADATPGDDPEGLAAQILAWLTSVWRYVDDPTAAEYIAPAVDSLEQLRLQSSILGDCDDVTVLGGAIGRALGFDVSITVVAFADNPWAFTHVWASLLTPDGPPVSLDILKPAAGSVPPIARSRTFVLRGAYATAVAWGASMRVSSRRFIPAGSSGWQGSQLGLIPLAAAEAVPTVVSGAQSIVGQLDNLFGDTHKYGQPQFTGAEKSRADTYILGIAGGSVLAGQYLLSQNRTDTSTYARQYTQQAIAQVEAAYPETMKEASMQGPVPDAADGAGGLRILLQLRIPYTSQYAGYSTNTGGPPTGSTLTLVNQVAALPQPGTPAAIAGHAASALQAGFSNPWLVLAVGGAVIWGVVEARHQRRRRSS